MSAAPASREVVVVKLGGNLVGDPMLAAAVRDIAELASESACRVLVVHGGGPQTSAMQKRLGQVPTKIGGRRVTDRDALDVLKMVVAGQLNVGLCAALLSAGADPVGLNGTSACVIEAERRPPQVILGGPPEPVDLGLVGDVVQVNKSLLNLLIDDGYLPVLACVGASRSGAVFNINADVVANRLAVELGASALVLAARDVGGVLADVDDATSTIHAIDEARFGELVKDGTIAGGMIPKVEEAFAAIRGGVERVHIVGKLQAGDLARAVREPGTVGTMLCADQRLPS